MNETTNVTLDGVGGQGILITADVLARTAAEAGLDGISVTFTPLPAKNGYRMTLDLTQPAIETIHRKGSHPIRIRCNGETAEVVITPFDRQPANRKDPAP